MVIDRLVQKIRHLQAPIVVGLDPFLAQIPDFLKKNCGPNPTDFISAFFKEIIDHISDIVPAVKPQIALYEQFGIDGIRCYFDIVSYARKKGLVVIGDIKRGDISSSAEGYSAAHIGKQNTEAPADFVTITPYLGGDSVEPFIDDCKLFDRGLFVLVKTSNKGSKDIQDVLLENGKPLYAHVARLVSDWGKDTIGEYGYSRVGAVVGATHPEEALFLRKHMPNTFFLVPGYGAQGGSGKDLKDLWTKDTYGLIVNSSRGITGAYKTDKHKAPDTDFAKAAREAVLAMKKDLGAFIV